MPETPSEQRAEDLDRSIKKQSEIWQHVKSGGLYCIQGECLIEADLTPAIIYRSLCDGAVWVRPTAEFYDGRFRNLAVDEVPKCTPKD